MTAALDILLLDRSDRLAAILNVSLSTARLMAQCHRLATIESLYQTLERRTSWDLILCGGGFRASQVFEVIRQTGCDAPFMVIDPSLSVDSANQLLTQGVNDISLTEQIAPLAVRLSRVLRDADRQRQDRHAEARSRLLAQAVEHSPVAVQIANAQGAIEYVNPKFQAMTGYSRVDAIGRPLDFTCLDHPGGQTLHQLRPILEAGRDWCGTLCGRQMNGTLFGLRSICRRCVMLMGRSVTI